MKDGAGGMAIGWALLGTLAAAIVLAGTGTLDDVALWLLHLAFDDATLTTIKYWTVGLVLLAVVAVVVWLRRESG